MLPATQGAKAGGSQTQHPLGLQRKFKTVWATEELGLLSPLAGILHGGPVLLQVCPGLSVTLPVPRTCLCWFTTEVSRMEDPSRFTVSCMPGKCYTIKWYPGTLLTKRNFLCKGPTWSSLQRHTAVSAWCGEVMQ